MFGKNKNKAEAAEAASANDTPEAVETTATEAQKQQAAEAAASKDQNQPAPDQDQASQDKPQEAKKAPEAPQADNRPTFEYKGSLYAFRKETPEALRMFGKPVKISELIKDSEAMELLISGNNYFVQRTKKLK